MNALIFEKPLIAPLRHSVISRMHTLQAWGANYTQIVNALAKKLDANVQNVANCLYKNHEAIEMLDFEMELLEQIDDSLIELEHQTAVMVEQLKRVGRRVGPNQMKLFYNLPTIIDALHSRA